MRKKLCSILLTVVCVLNLLSGTINTELFNTISEVSGAVPDYKLVPPETINYSPMNTSIPYDEYMEKNTTVTEYRYYKCEPLTWNILSEEDGVLTVISDKILDVGLNDDCAQVYWQTVNSEYESRESVWSWINAGFKEDAFTEKEVALVEHVLLPDSKQMENAVKEFYGEKGITITATDYAKAQGAKDNDFMLNNPNVFWEEDRVLAYDVPAMTGFFCPYECGVCPIMNVNVGTDYWEYQQQTGGNVTTFQWGSYPQTEVTGEALTAEIRDAEYDENGYCTIDGVRYKKLGIAGEKDPQVFSHTYYEFWNTVPIASEDPTQYAPAVDKLTVTSGSVDIVNPLKGRTDLSENVVDALTKTGVPFAGYVTYAPDGSYYCVENVSTQAAAIERYEERLEQKEKEYEARCLVYYVEHINTDAIVLVGNETSGYAVEATGGSISLAEAMYYRAVVEYGSPWALSGGVLANKNNFIKKIENYQFIPTEEQLMNWSNGELPSIEEVVEYTEAHMPRNELVALENNPAETTPEKYTFPYPTWEQGASVSLWVKATTDAAADVFEFTDGTAKLVLKSDGTVRFQNSTDANSVLSKNVFSAQYTGGAPSENVGEWVHVTLTAKNDGIKVYYDGKEAEITYLIDNATDEGSYFNYGTGVASDDVAIETRIGNCVIGGNYLNALKGFGLSTDYSDFSKYTLNGMGEADYVTIMDLLTIADMRLTSAESEDAEISYIGNVAFFDYIPTEEEVAAIYTDAVKEKSDAQINTPIENPGFVITDGCLEKVTDDAVTNGALTIPEGVKRIKADAFVSAGSIETIYLPNSIEELDADTFSAAVSGCTLYVYTDNEAVKNYIAGYIEANGGLGGSITFKNRYLADLDANETVNLEDANISLKVALGIITLEEMKPYYADRNCDGDVTLKDANMVLKDALGIKE